MLTTMTLEEVKRQPQMSDERLAEILSFEDTDVSDCPELTEEQLAQCRHKYVSDESQTDNHQVCINAALRIAKQIRTR